MKEERLEILKMVSEGKISVDEAERLIEALEGASDGSTDDDDRFVEETDSESDSERTPGGPRRFRRHRRRHGAKGRWKIDFDGLESFLGEIGSGISNAVSDALRGESRIVPDEEGYDPVRLEDGACAVAAGDSLVVRNDASGLVSGGGTISVEATDSDSLEVDSEGQATVWSKPDGRGNTAFLITWNEGPLHIKAPEGLACLTVKTTGGDLTGSLPRSLEELVAKTMGGDIVLTNAPVPLEVKTLGGDIILHAICATSGEGTISTMGGDIKLSFLPESSVTVHASTMAGDVSFEGGVGRLENEGGLVRRRSTFRMGHGIARLTASTMGGSIGLSTEKDTAHDEEESTDGNAP